MTTIREKLHADLKAELPPRKFRIIPSLGTVDRLAKPLIQLEQSVLSPAQGARGLRNTTIKVHVVTPKDGINQAADDDVDALGVEVMEALERIRYLTVGDATKGTWGSTHLAYEIEITTLIQRSQ